MPASGYSNTSKI